MTCTLAMAVDACQVQEAGLPPVSFHCVRTLRICIRYLEMAKKFPVRPKYPERNCWGCDKYCPAGSLNCGNGSDRTQHPVELFGEDWFDWGGDFVAEPQETADD